MRRVISREDRVLSAINDANDHLIAARYRVLDCIGEGGMGKVYEAEDIRTGRKFAIKFLKAELSADRTATERLIREARAASSIEHDNIVAVFDLGYLPSGSAYYVMEILRGESLAVTLQKQGRLPWPRVAGIALQLCDALAATHIQGIVHRDLKPENIFRTPRAWNPDFVKILDFGIAGIAQDGPDPQGKLTQTSDFLGTVSYMSPEQAGGDMTAHPRIDVYATGVLLYHLLTGSLPFRGENSLQVLRAIIDAHAPAMHIVAPDAGISPEIEGLVARAMHPDPKLRFPDMASFGAAIFALAPGAGTPPSVPQAPPTAKPPPSLTLAHRPTELAAPSSAIGLEVAGPDPSNDATTGPVEDTPRTPTRPAAPRSTETTTTPATTASQPYLPTVTHTAGSTPSRRAPKVAEGTVVVVEATASSPDTAVGSPAEAPKASTPESSTVSTSTTSSPTTTISTSSALNVTQASSTSAPTADNPQQAGDQSTSTPDQGSDHPRRRWWLLSAALVALVAGLVFTWQGLNGSENSPAPPPPEHVLSPQPEPTQSKPPHREPDAISSNVPPPQPEPLPLSTATEEAKGTSDIRKSLAPAGKTGKPKTSGHLTKEDIKRQVNTLANNVCAKTGGLYINQVKVLVSVKAGKSTIDSIEPSNTVGGGALACLKSLKGKRLGKLANENFTNILVDLQRNSQ